MRWMVVLAALVAAVSVSGASAQTGTNICHHRYTVPEFRTDAKRIYHQPNRVKPHQLYRLLHLRTCAVSYEARQAMNRIQLRQRKARIVRRERERYRAQVAALTPYPGPNGTHWAIPWYVVACESGGSWSAYNPSGAAGPYQIMAMHGRPFPVTSRADRLAHHRIAARLWAGGSGASHWVCA